MNDPQSGTNSLTLADGRNLAYCVHGDRDARPVIWFDGTPGSRLTTVLDYDRLAVRLVTFDRPGYGESDRRSGRTVADVTSDVTQLADHLELGRWVAAGYSGGGPHALACGARLSGQVEAVAAIATVGPPHELHDWANSALPTAVQAWATIADDPARYDDQLRHMRAALEADPVEGMIAAFGDGGSDSDTAFLHDPTNREILDASLREALRPGHEGWLDDEIALHRPWGFALTDVAVPVHFLHGTVDPIAPLSHAREMAERIPRTTFDKVADVGHLAVLNHLNSLAPTIHPSASSRILRRT